MQEDVDVIGLSVLSGAHLPITREVISGLLRDALDIPVMVGGTIPTVDEPRSWRLAPRSSSASPPRSTTSPGRYGKKQVERSRRVVPGEDDLATPVAQVWRMRQELEKAVQ